MGQWWDTKRDYDWLCARARNPELIDTLFIDPEEY